MQRSLYLATMSIVAVLVFAPAALAQQQGPPNSAPIIAPGYPPACVDFLPGGAQSIQAKAEAALDQNPGEFGKANSLDKNGNGVACESEGKILGEGLKFEDGSIIIGSSIDYRVGEYIRGSNANFGPNRRDENNYVVEYSGTAGNSHYDGVIGVAIGRPNTQWGYNYYIIYDHQELNRLGYNYYGRAKLTRHERAHTRGWGHYDGNKRINQAYCPTMRYNGTTPC